MIIYLIKSSLCLSAFLLVYYFILERENMHVFKRFYLLFSLAFSFIVPLISFEFKAENTLAAASNTLQTIVLPTIQITTDKNYLSFILYSIYGLITIIFLFRFIWNLYTIQKVRKNAVIIPFQNAKLALVDAPILPHTFGNTIFINKQSYESQDIETELFTHELTHVREKHTLDVLLIELLKTIFWFNPLLILYRRAIQLNHEFLADQKVISAQNNISIYQYLLLSYSQQPCNFYLTSNLNSFLKTKKRFIMMTKTTSQSRALLKKLALFPVVAGLIFISCSKTESKVSSITPEVYLNGKKVNDSEMNKPLSELIKTKKILSKKIIATTEGIATDSISKEVMEVDPENDVFNAVDKKPDFPGGMKAFYNFVGQNFKAPEAKVNGKVYVQFIVEADGSLSNFEVMRDVGHGTGEEAVRVLKLSPKWIPGEQDGTPVRVQYSLPISITGS